MFTDSCQIVSSSSSLVPGQSNQSFQYPTSIPPSYNSIFPFPPPNTTMKTTIISLSILFSLISAALVSIGTITIRLNTGGSNYTTQVTVPFERLFDAPGTFLTTPTPNSGLLNCALTHRALRVKACATTKQAKMRI